MKTVFRILSGDLRRMTASVVAIVTLMGLCIIPCLYAWFNIFSNWAPYDTAATSRIKVAVANEDAGAAVLGLQVNVGEKIITALEANDAIGWVFLDDADAALEGVRASDYYAALIIPAAFTEDALSFLSGDLTNPQLLYYENEKKNAIAPKITGKAKNAVQEQVNATFVQTIAAYISDGVSVLEASGHDPQDVMRTLSDRTAVMSERLNDCGVMLQSAQSLVGAAQALLRLSGTLVTDTGTLLDAGQTILGLTEDAISDGEQAGDNAADALKTLIDRFGADLDDLSAALSTAFSDMNRYNDFAANDLSARAALLTAYQTAAETASEDLRAMGLSVMADQFADLAARYARLAALLGGLEVATEESWRGVRRTQKEITAELDAAGAIVQALGHAETDAVHGKLEAALAAAETAVEDASRTLRGAGGTLGTLSGVLTSYGAALGDLQGGLSGTGASVASLQEGAKLLSGVLERLSDSAVISRLTGILSDDAETIAAYFASPVRMDTQVIYEVREYGSAMAPFYTVLAQWVGALLAAVLLKVQIKNERDDPRLRAWQRFFGRYGLFLFVGLAQGLIVSLGDLIYVGIQCLHPVRFVLAACLNGVCFTMINYALVFALDNIGMALGVIILVLQVAGAGGTYPVEVLPEVFQRLYPAMPFRYAMDAMRECVAGMYGYSYDRCMGMLALFTLGAVLFGLALYYPAKWLNRLIAESKEKSEIML